MRTRTRDNTQSRAIAATAASIVTDSEFLNPAAGSPIPPDEVIVMPNPDGYHVPDFLQNTAPELAGEFAELLEQLAELNALCAGERTVDVQAQLSFSGEHELLEQAFLDWCRRYFSRRGDLSRLSSKVHNCPWNLYHQCVIEFHKLIDERLNAPGTINSTVLNLSQRYILNSFACEMLQPELDRREKLGWDRFCSDLARNMAEKQVVDFRDGVTSFSKTMSDLRADLPQEYLETIEEESITDVLSHVQSLAKDLSCLRTALFAINEEEASRSRITLDLWASLRWDVHHGSSVAAVKFRIDGGSLRSTAPAPIAIRRDGWICHREFPWIRVDPEFELAARRHELAVNWFILDTFVDRLLSVWDQLDKPEAIQRGGEPDATIEEQIAAIAVATLEREDSEPSSGRTTGRKSSRLRPMKLSRLEVILRDGFGCETRQGKGSERIMSRPGGKLFRFGRHGVDKEVYPDRIKQCLARLEIPVGDFLCEC